MWSALPCRIKTCKLKASPLLSCESKKWGRLFFLHVQDAFTAFYLYCNRQGGAVSTSYLPTPLLKINSKSEASTLRRLRLRRTAEDGRNPCPSPPVPERAGERHCPGGRHSGGTLSLYNCNL
jgi:hypothetical protein